MTTTDTPLLTWDPKFGHEFDRFVHKKKPPQQQQLRKESPRVLGACVDPTTVLVAPRRNAGLVLGYVQSGKTSSFTAVAAMAKDNDYDLIIVVAGTTEILTNQTNNRLKEDLDLTTNDVVNRWLHSVSPEIGPSPAAQQLQQNLSTRADRRLANMPVNLPTPIVVVMKQNIQLKKLNELMAGLAGPAKDKLRGLTVLIVDDECHMHTPNVGKPRIEAEEEEKSTIYRRMRELRSYFPHHTLLQYTATPQANLVCDLQDEFKSDFVRLLGTGDDYVGGDAYFFGTPKGAKIRTIPAAEQGHALGAAGPKGRCPDSLRTAFASFLLLCANDRVVHPNILEHERFDMLVHAHKTNKVQDSFNTWLQSLRDTWKGILGLNPLHPDRVSERDRWFLPAHSDLTAGGNDILRPLDELFGQPLTEVLDELRIWKVNQRKDGTNNVDFNVSKYNVLNGGEMLGVGFTVPRLHISHVLRPPGQRQLDSIQQRGRFFGYRKPYFHKTRVWMEDELRKYFELYVVHERDLRQSLRRYDEQNLSLRNWKVRFRMQVEAGTVPNDSKTAAQLTRAKAIRLYMRQFKTDTGWVYQRNWTDNQETKNENRELVRRFLGGEDDFAEYKKLEFEQAPRELRGPGEKSQTDHQQSTCTLAALMRLLSEYIPESRDRANFEMLRTTLDEIMSPEGKFGDLRNQPVDVFHMAGGFLPQRRIRRVVENGSFDLMQGSNPAKGKGPVVYVGDRGVHRARIALQLHFLNHGDDPAAPVEEDVVYLAVWVPDAPRKWAEGFLIQAE